MTESTKPTGLKLLRMPFAENQISLLPKPFKRDSPKGKCAECNGYHGLPAVHLKYVGHAALTDRLLDCDENWSWEPVASDPDGLPKLDKDGGMWIRLTVCGVTRLGYGDAQGKSGPDATKERIGDALRNAAMRFGAALDLWHKGDLHGVEEDERAPQKSRQAPAKQAPAVLPMDEDELEGCISAMQDCDDMHVLQAIFGAGYKRGNVDQKPRLQAVYEHCKKTLSEL